MGFKRLFWGHDQEALKRIEQEEQTKLLKQQNKLLAEQNRQRAQPVIVRQPAPITHNTTNIVNNYHEAPQPIPVKTFCGYCGGKNHPHANKCEHCRGLLD
jgi:ribosomal protein L40E